MEKSEKDDLVVVYVYVKSFFPNLLENTVLQRQVPGGVANVGGVANMEGYNY